MSAWINQEQHFGFIELRSEEDATNGLVLNQQIIFKSNILKVGRPKKSGAHVHRTNMSTNAEFTIDNELLTQPLDLEFLNSIEIDNIDFNAKYHIDKNGVEI